MGNKKAENYMDKTNKGKAKQIRKEHTNIGAELSKIMEKPKSLKELGVLEMAFVTAYSIKGKKPADALKDAYSSLGASLPKIGNLEMMANAMLMSPLIKNADKEIRAAYVSQTENIMAKTGVTIAETFSKVSTSDDDRKRLEKRIKTYDLMIEEAEVLGDFRTVRQLSNEQLKFIQRLETVKDGMRKDIAVIDKVVGANKQKTVLKAGSISINIGNTKPQREDKGTIVADIPDQGEMIDISELTELGDR